MNDKNRDGKDGYRTEWDFLAIGERWKKKSDV